MEPGEILRTRCPERVAFCVHVPVCFFGQLRVNVWRLTVRLAKRFSSESSGPRGLYSLVFSWFGGWVSLLTHEKVLLLGGDLRTGQSTLEFRRRSSSPHSLSLWTLFLFFGNTI